MVLLLGGTAVITWERLARLPRMRLTALALGAVGAATLLLGAYQLPGKALAADPGTAHSRHHSAPPTTSGSLLCTPRQDTLFHRMLTIP